MSEDLISAINHVEQVNGELWGRAHTLLKTEIGMNAEIVHLGRKYTTTPLVRYRDETNYIQPYPELNDESFAIASENGGARKINDDSLFLIVNGNYKNPLFQFNAYSREITFLGSSAGPEGIEGSAGQLDAILGRLEKDQANRQRANELDSEQERRRFVLSLVGIAVAGASLVGGSIYADKRNERDRAARRAEQEVRAKFDKRDLTLPGASVRAGELAFVSSNLKVLANNIPVRKGSEKLDHPRLVKLSSSICTKVVTIDPLKEAVRTATDAAPENIFVAANSVGDVYACYFGDIPSDSSLRPKLAVQVVENSKK